MNRSKTRIFIGGMTCVNCQNKIETALLHTAGIEIARVSYQNGTADLVYDPDWITLEEIQQVIRDAGYEVLSEKARNKQKPGRAAHILIVIAVLYVLLENSGILNRLVPSQSLLAFPICPGTEVTIQCEGEDEEEALKAMLDCIHKLKEIQPETKG